jgi:serine/threonine-protein kinase
VARDPKACQRFFSERDLSSRVRHPAAVPIQRTGRTPDGVPFLMMELLQGETLSQRWKRTGRFSIRRALMIGERLLDFIASCHAVGLVHRDLKPGNVFLCDDGSVRVIDFGIAVVRGKGKSGQFAVLGTPAFMSPEQAKGQSDDADHRADLFAIGAILWSLLSGQQLRAGREALELAARDHARSLSLVAPDMPRSVAALVDRALATDPAERWESAPAMRREITAILDAIDADLPALPDPSPSERNMRVHRVSFPPLRSSDDVDTKVV